MLFSPALKAQTALRSRQPTSIRTAQLKNDPGGIPRQIDQFGFFTNSGGIPIVVDGQMIGAVGVGGGNADEQQDGLQARGERSSGTWCGTGGSGQSSRFCHGLRHICMFMMSWYALTRRLRTSDTARKETLALDTSNMTCGSSTPGTPR